MSEKKSSEIRLDPRWTVFRCPSCDTFICEGIAGGDTHLETYCRRCKKPKDGDRPRIVIERKAA